MKYMMLDPVPPPNWDYKQFNFDTDPARLAAAAEKVNATNPDLQAFRRRGGKLIH